MYISRIKLQNWRNFGQQGTETDNLGKVNYILGPNACGKSNLLDALRFLRDIAKPKGGGLQGAIDSRGGMKKLRCLHATSRPNIIIEVDISNNDQQKLWSYTLEFNLPQRGDRKTQPIEIKKEIVTGYENDSPGKILERPDKSDREDKFLLSETHLEQSGQNRKFRKLAEFFSGITYVHLVPQLLKFSDQIGGQIVEEDPFGQAFMKRISETRGERKRNTRLKKIELALTGIIPGLEELTFIKDEDTGHPHLQIRFPHYRPAGGFQREDQFSDGTLRLIALLWMLQEEGESPLLLEEPELSLNEEIVRQIPEMIDIVQKRLKSSRQIFITTHSEALLSDEDIGPDGVVIIQPETQGSILKAPDEASKDALAAGFSVAEAILPLTQGEDRQISLLDGL